MFVRANSTTLTKEVFIAQLTHALSQLPALLNCGDTHIITTRLLTIQSRYQASVTHYAKDPDPAIKNLLQQYTEIKTQLIALQTAPDASVPNCFSTP